MNSIVGWVAVEPYLVGRHSYISEFTHISQNTIIGNFCSVGNLCTIGATKHRFDCLTSFPFEELREPALHTVIGSDVWVGCNSVILGGVSVDHGAVIGAGSVVTKPVPAYAIVAGNPAKVLRYRFPPELIKALLEVKWWDLPAETIKKLPMMEPWKCIEIIRGLTRAM